MTGSYDTATGILTLSGPATVAAYQTALRSVTYVNSSESPNPAPRTVSFQGTDDTATASGSGNERTAAAGNLRPGVPSGNDPVCTAWRRP